MARAAASVVIVLGAIVGLGVAAAPAYADPGTGTFSASTSSSLNDFHPGDSQQYKVSATNDATTPEDPNAQMSATLTISPASDFTISVQGNGGCSGGNSCTFKFGGSGGTVINMTFVITAKPTVDVPAGGKTAVNITVAISDNQSTAKSVQDNATLFGPVPAVVVTGAVYNENTGAVVSGAFVNVLDSSGHSYTETTPSSGKFSFTSTSSKPLVGSLVIGATKDKFKTVPLQIGAGAKTTDLHVLMQPVAVATPTPTPSATPSAPASAPAVGGPSGVASGDPSNTALSGADLNTSGGSSFGTIVLILGLILVIGGGGAIGYILWRRKKRDDGYDDGGADGEPDPYNPRGGRGGTPDRTAIGRPGLADAPTMMHRGGLVDEYADPYGAPPNVTRPPTAPRQPGPAYGQPGYAQAQAYPPNQGYGAEPPYPDAQTAMYRRPPAQRPPADPYQTYAAPAPAPAYGAEPNGYAGYPASGPPGGAPAGPPAGPSYPPQPPGYQAPPPRGGYQGQPGYSGADYAPPTQHAAPAPPPAAPAYPADNGYGRHDQAGAGYGAEPAYDDHGYTAPGYPGGAANGYDAGYNATPGYQPYPGEYGADQAGYEQGGGYEAEAGYPEADGYQQDQYQQGGYPPEQYPPEGYGQGAGYQPGGGYPAQQPPPPPPPPAPYQQSGPGYRGGYTPPDQRGTVDWLDD